MITDRTLEEYMESLNKASDKASPANKLSLIMISSILEEYGQEIIQLKLEIENLNTKLRKYL